MFKSVLWLASWYPNRVGAFDGDFIERHAKAVSRFANLTVLFVIKDETLKDKTVEIEKTVNQHLVVYKVYYGRAGWGERAEKFFSLRKYSQLQKKIYRQIISETGRPDIVHVQVAMKAGILARWLKKKYRVPFLVTEHWTGYYRESVPNIYAGNFLFKMLSKKIIKDAALFLPVSDDLGKMVNLQFMSVPYKVIPNTVDTDLFYYQPTRPGKFRFIHPSFMNYQKNPEGILKACEIVKEKGYDFELLMVGNRPQRLIELSYQYNLEANLIFEAVVPYAIVAKRMQQSSALLLFSRFENLPCVVLEALCCGLPVISSRVGGIHEVVDKENGILVESENIAALAGAMMQMIDSYGIYNLSEISGKATALFNYDTVGMQYAAVYNDILAQP